MKSLISQCRVLPGHRLWIIASGPAAACRPKRNGKKQGAARTAACTRGEIRLLLNSKQILISSLMA